MLNISLKEPCNVRIEVFEEGNFDSPIFTEAIGNSRVFRMPSMKKDNYVVKAIPLDDRRFKYSSAFISFSTVDDKTYNDHLVHVTLPLLYRKKESTSK